MTTPENPAAPSARPRKPRAPRQDQSAQATSAAQTAQNPTPDQTPTPAGQDVLEVLVVPDVPPGWYVFGSHADRPGVMLEFSEETEEGGMPLWERPIAIPAVIDGVLLDDHAEIAGPDPAHPYQRVVRTLLGPGFDGFLKNPEG